MRSAPPDVLRLPGPQIRIDKKEDERVINLVMKDCGYAYNRMRQKNLAEMKGKGSASEMFDIIYEEKHALRALWYKRAKKEPIWYERMNGGTHKGWKRTRRHKFDGDPYHQQ
jgi:hypothetical protein